MQLQEHGYDIHTFSHWDEVKIRVACNGFKLSTPEDEMNRLEGIALDPDPTEARTIFPRSAR